MTHYSILAVTPTDDGWVEAYVPAVNRLIAKHGGKYLARTADHERLGGEGEDAALRIVLEWPAREAARAFVNDPEYGPYLRSRLGNSESHHFLVAGTDDLA